LFDAAARGVVAVAGRSPVRLLVGVFLLAAAVTVVFSLDATAVLLTPVVLGAAARVGVSSRPGTYACLRMANSASLLLPVSNLTNLLALPDLDLTFVGFAARMAPVLVVVLALELVALLLLLRRDLARRQPLAAGPAAAVATVTTVTGGPDAPDSVPVVPVVTVVAMMLGFAAGSPLGVDPAWIAVAAALVLVTWARARGLLGLGDAVRAANPSFAVFVLALGVVVAVLSRGFLGEAVAPLLPGRGSALTWVGLLVVAVVATVLANLLTNLSATLLVVPLVAPLGDTVVLAALLGLNIGSGLTYSGSLANLLWRRGLSARGVRVPMGELHRFSLVVTPVVLLAAVTTLWATQGWFT
jgi:arsenical pump membrane protein